MPTQIKPAFMASPEWKAARSRKANASRWHGRESDEYARRIAEINAVAAIEYARAMAASDPPLDTKTLREVIAILRAAGRRGVA